jgi:WD40 repeat protein
MAQWQTCPRGHRWQSTEEQSACPTCVAESAETAGSLPHAVPVVQAVAAPKTIPFVPEAAAAATDPSPQVPGYEIQGVLGRGGMGVVYKARHVGLDRVVALKMLLHIEHATPEAINRFRIEARSVARLQHPHIVQVYEVGEQQGTAFLSLEYCAGGNLDQKLAGTPLPAREAAGLVVDLAGAVQAAHDGGIVHRDLKPANVLLTAEGIAKITDFGLAKTMADQGQTQSGIILGTPSYMSPEQACGKGRAVGPLTDVYALGAILYECLTGRPPFRGPTSLDTLMQVSTDEPAPPTQLQPQTPRDLETICLKGLEKEPRRRYACARDFAADLQRYLRGEPIHARPTPALERGWKWARRYPAAALVLFLLAVPMPALLLYVATLWRDATEARDEARKRTAEVTEERNHAKELADSEGAARRQIAEDHQRTEGILYAARIALAQQEWYAGNVGRTRQLLDECLPAMRGWEWRYLRNLCSEQRLLMGDSGAILTLLAWGGDGRFLAALGADQRLRLWDAAAGSPAAVLPAVVSAFAFTPDGSRLATGQGNTVRIWAVSGEELLRFHTRGHLISSLAFVEDGQTLGVAHWDGMVEFFDPLQGQPTRKSPLRIGEHSAIAFSPDGRRLAVAIGEEVRVLDTAEGNVKRRWKGPLLFIPQVAFSPDSHRVAAAGHDGNVRVWDVEDGRELQRLRGHGAAIRTLAWSPDGRLLLTGAGDLTARLWNASSGDMLLTFRGHLGEVWGVAFRPDGKQAATASNDGTARVWDIEGRRVVGTLVRVLALASRDLQAHIDVVRQEATTFWGHLGANCSVAFHPDGKRLATAAAGDGLVKVWDLANRLEMQTVSVPRLAAHQLLFSPVGDTLAAVSSGTDTQAAQLTLEDLREARTRLLRGPPGARTAAAFRPDGKHLAWLVSSDKESRIQVVDLDKGKDIVAGLSLPVTRLSGLTYTSDGRSLLVVGGDGKVRLLDPETCREVRSFALRGNGVAGVSCSANGLLALGCVDGVIRLWDLGANREVGELSGHVGVVHCVAFNPAGDRLASCGNDLTAKVWHVPDRRELLTFRSHGGLVDCVAWSPDGRRLASAGQDGTTLLYEVPEPAQTQGWQMVFADDFRRITLDERWSVGAGQWAIENGGLSATSTKRDRHAPFARAEVGLNVELPSTAAVSFACRASAPTDVQVSFVASGGTNGLAALVGGSTADGAALLRLSGGQRAFALEQARGVSFEPGRRYRFRVVRLPHRLSLFIDDNEIVAARVPALAAPWLRLETLHGAEGTTVAFEDVQVTAPREAIREQELTTQVKALLAEPLPRREVIKRLRSNRTLSDDDLQVAVRLADELPEDAARLHAAAREALVRRNLDREALALATRRAQTAADLRPHDPVVLETFALALYRSEKAERALSVLDRAARQSRAVFGSVTPVSLAVRVLAHNHLGQLDAARTSLRQLSDPMLSRTWATDRDAGTLHAEVKELVGPLLPPPTAAERDADAVRQAVVHGEQAGCLDHDRARWLDLWTDDAVAVHGRSESPGPEDVTLDRARMAGFARLTFCGPAPAGRRDTYEDLQVEINGDEARLRGKVTAAWDGGFESRAVDYRLRRSRAGWKVDHRRDWPLIRKEGPEITHYDAATFSKLAGNVDAARRKADARELIDALSRALRFSEAHAETRKLTDKAGPTAEDWLLRSRMALRAGDPEDALAALRRASQIDPAAVPAELRPALAEK